MIRLKKLVLGALVTGAFLLVPLPSVVLAQGTLPCQFSLGFAAIRGLITTQVGSCLDNESHSALNGDATQHTTGGLLVWRKADNWTAFTDGYHSWVNGPNGLQERLNTQRFPWEAQTSPPQAASTLLDIRGTGSVTTTTFNPQGAWDMAWSFNCADGQRGNYFIDIRGPNGEFVEDTGRGPAELAVHGEGVTHMHHGGPQVLEIQTTCDWHVKVTG